jgi:hypothetical protein
MASHLVLQGQCLTQIASLHGFADARTLHDHPENAALKRRRPDFNILHPGDRVFIPEHDGGEVSRPTGARHRFVAKVPRRMLRLELQTPQGQPRRDVEYAIELEGVTLTGKTGADGKIEHPIPVDATEGRLILDDVVYPIAIGWLNPLRDTPDGGVSGVQGRLQKLGFGPASITGEIDAPTRAAIADFRAAVRLPEGDAIDEPLLSALEREHQS